MDRHVVTFAIEHLLARTVKVKLFQLIGLAAYGDVTSRAVIDHDAVPVIDDMQRGRFVVKLDGRQISFAGIANIDGRLTMASLARSKLRLKIAPMFGSLCPAVTPGMLRVMLLGRGWCRRRKHPQHHHDYKVVSNHHIPQSSAAPIRSSWPQQSVHVLRALCRFQVCLEFGTDLCSCRSK